MLATTTSMASQPGPGSEQSAVSRAGDLAALARRSSTRCCPRASSPRTSSGATARPPSGFRPPSGCGDPWRPLFAAPIAGAWSDLRGGVLRSRRGCAASARAHGVGAAIKAISSGPCCRSAVGRPPDMDSTASKIASPRRRPRLLIRHPTSLRQRECIQVVIHRLAAGMKGFETSDHPDAPGAARFDSESCLRRTTVHGGARLRGGRNAVLNAAALGQALSFRPAVTLCAHTSPVRPPVRSAGCWGPERPSTSTPKRSAPSPGLAAVEARQADVSIPCQRLHSGVGQSRGWGAGEDQGDPQRHRYPERSDARAQRPADLLQSDRPHRGALQGP